MAAFMWGVGRYQRFCLDLLKIQGVTYYVKGVQGLRQVVVSLLCVAALMGLGVTGFILLHAGLVVLIYSISGSWFLPGVVLLVLGATYMAVVVFALRYYTDERNWMRWTGANRLVDEVMRGKEKD